MAALPNTAVVLVDPYNDFLHPDGKLTPRLQDLQDNDTIKHMEELVSAARHHGIPIYYGLHQQATPATFIGWNRMSTSNKRQAEMLFFEHGTFGAEIYQSLKPDEQNGDVVVSHHWNSE